MMYKTLTIEEVAEAAFVANELVKALELSNSSQDYDERKKQYIMLAKARLAANEANSRLENYIKKAAVEENDKDQMKINWEKTSEEREK